MRASPIDKWLPLVADLAFGLYLAAEIFFSHSLISQTCMLLFFCVIVLYCLRRRRLYFSWWMAAILPFILWGGIVTRLWAVDAASSASMVQTMLINAVYFFFLFQYFMLQGDMRRYMTVFVVLATVVGLYALLRAMPYQMQTSRVGINAGINPNIVGMISAVASGFCLVLARQKSAFWLLALLVLLPAVLLSKSALAAIEMVIVLSATYLILFPKRWWLKLAAILAFIAAMLVFVVYPENVLSEGIFNRVRGVLVYYIDGTPASESAVIRGGYLALALKAFASRPWAGYGLANFRLFDGADGTYSHNNYAELLVSGGIVMLVLYYLPLIIALGLGARALYRSYRIASPAKETRERANLGLFMMLALASLVADYGSVPFFERIASVVVLLLVSATRLMVRTETDGTHFFAVLKNPYQLFVMLSHRGYFKRMQDERYLRLLYRGAFGRKLRLDPPLMFSEKVQWMKLHDKNPLYPTLCDKIAVRDYVKERIGGEYLVPQLGVWDDPNDIDFTILPERFVLKCTHDSGSAVFITDKSKMNVRATRQALKKRLKRDYSRLGREWPYQSVPRRVLAEAFIGKPDGTLPDDYKFYCVRGKVLWICLCTNRRRSSADYVVCDLSLQPFWTNIRSVAHAEDIEMTPPAHLQEMIALSERLAKGLTHIRVDLYDTPNGVYFGETTLYDQSGMTSDYDEEMDRKLGDLIVLENEPA